LKTTNGGGLVSINPVINSLPKAFTLYQNYPNPFNPTTVIKFQVPSSRFVKLTLFDILGREIAALVNEQLQPGAYEVKWDASNYPSGVYYYKLTSGDYTETKKLILIK
jgi:hypothetical protein